MADASGTAAIVTAVGGVFVSLAAVWAQGRKSSKDVEGQGHDCEARINALTDQITDMAVDLSLLRAENATLKTEVAVLKEQLRP